MDREFEALCLGIQEKIENGDVRLLFGDSWYWLHYEFFQCRDNICSEESSAVRTHLYNLAAMLYKGMEELPDSFPADEEKLHRIIAELVEIAEYSKSFPVSLWIYGDETSKKALKEALSKMPSKEQLDFLLSLPHSYRRERERLSYAHNEPNTALKRYRNELAAYNKRTKNSKKNEQRSQQEAEQNVDPNA